MMATKMNEGSLNYESVKTYDSGDGISAFPYRLWLSANLPASKIRLLQEAGFRAMEIWGMEEERLREFQGLTDKELDRLLLSRKTWDLRERVRDMEEKGISFICSEESGFPEKLRNISNPPYALYYRGRLPDPTALSVAIVGSRARSAYGQQAAQKLAQGLGESGVQVVSGLATGIDTDSHKGCLAGGGVTYAVLGCGPDVVYPRQNAYLYDSILERGGIISEYPPGTQPLPHLFPLRNRIISGLADKVVVIEARKKSGSLITADYAMEQGKDVYALPGRITDPLSQGTNQLIHQGAQPITSIDEFLSDLRLIHETPCVQMDFLKNLLEKDESLVYSLVDFAPVGLGNLLDETGIEIGELLDILERLMRKGFIKEPVPNYFVRAM